MDTIGEKKKALFTLLWNKSYRYREDPPFTLVSGKKSPYYIDCKPTSNNAEGMVLIGELIFESIKDLEVNAIGGLTMGADPIAHATSVISQLKGKPIHSFCVRKTGKDHGTSRMVEGDVKPGDRVVIVDDVITTGASTIQAIEEARKFGLEIVKVVVLVDREDEGKENIERLGPVVESLFTLSDFRGFPEKQRD